jgi:pimeloyl-ACP methyl ester carboxylesterase
LRAGVLHLDLPSGVRVEADVYGGAGRPVILLHGGGQTRHSWRRTGELLAEAGYRALPFDQRGHGASSRAPGQRYTFFDFAADAHAIGHAVAERFGSPPALVGASLGGLSGLIASHLPPANPFAALVLVDVTPRMDPNGVAAVQGFMSAKAADGFATVEEAAAAIAAYLPHRPKPTSLDGLRKNLRKAADGRFYWHWDPAFLAGPFPIEHGRGNVERAALDAAAALAIPSLLVRGRNSELVREEQAQEYLALAKGSDFVDVKDARHMVAGDSNNVFSTAVLKFLQQRLPAP